MTPDDELKVATFYARPEWREIRHLVRDMTFAQIEALMKRVRRQIWRDFSEPT